MCARCEWEFDTAVILACGGFEADPAMQAQYWPGGTALSAAYAEFTEKSPLQTRLFKVLRDRDPARPVTRGALVPLSDLTG